jgi:zinc/manganese transport system substrate-binding protein
VRFRILCVVAVAALAASATPARAAIKVVATTEDLAALTREVGGDKVSVESLAKGYQDPHFVEPKPSFILKLHDADLLIAVGRELEIGWLPPLIQQSRNARVQPGGPGYLDASMNVKILDIPTGQITRAMGDVHPQGNPHYWLDPGNGRRIAQAIQQKLSSLSAADAAYFAQRYADFDKSPAHTIDVIQEMKRDNVKVIAVEPYFDLKTPNAIARETGAQVLVLSPSVGGVKEASSYIALFDYNIGLLTKALGGR